MAGECKPPLLPENKTDNRHKVHVKSHRVPAPEHYSSHVVYYFISVSPLLSPGSCPEWKLFRSTIQQHDGSTFVVTTERSTLTWWWTTLAWRSRAEKRGSCSSSASSTPVLRRERRPPRDTSSSLVGPGTREMGGCVHEVWKNKGGSFSRIMLFCYYILSPHEFSMKKTQHREQPTECFSLFCPSYWLTHTHTQFQFAFKHYFLSCHPLVVCLTQMFAHSSFMYLIGLFKTEI